MKKIVECVPNFSEGRNQEIIDAIAESIKHTPGCTLLDVDPGKSTNRTVYTFVGSPEAIVDGAINASKTARKLIDMRHHKGEHPRMGALDVCPFVPVANVTMEECVQCANEYGRRAAEEIGISVMLYEYAAKQDYRRKLPQIREGEYEAMAEKLQKKEWKPDYGPTIMVPEWGVTAAGARDFLIAYNVNILGTNNQAHRIALNLRENGRSDNEPGLLKEVKAMGWFVDEYNMAQVTANLTNYKITSPHAFFEEVKREAKELNVGIAGSELVGLIPLEAMLMAADYYMEKENLFIIDEDQKIKLVVDRMGLNSISKFDPNKRIIEYQIKEENNQPLANLTVKGFVDSIAARTSAPGGGSASAAIAAIGAGLGCMVGQLTFGVRKFESVEKNMRNVIPPLYNAAKELTNMIDADTNAFNDYMEALRLPKNTPEEKDTRHNAMQLGLKKAIEIPFKTMTLGFSCWEAMIELAQFGNIASKSDVEVGAKSLQTGIWGAYKNVLINMPGIDDIDFKKQKIQDAENIINKSDVYCNQVLEILDSRDKK